MLSGRFYASGSVLAQVHHVGADNYAAKLMLEAKTVKPINSLIMKSLDQLAGFTGKSSFLLVLLSCLKPWS